MNIRRKSLYIQFSIVFIAATASLTSNAEYPIAGVLPDHRPIGAPVITEMDKGNAWYDQALVGVVTPYPQSLRFLEDQGSWYTPFIHPGMTGPYDIRGWHE